MTTSVFWYQMSVVSSSGTIVTDVPWLERFPVEGPAAPTVFVVTEATDQGLYIYDGIHIRKILPYEDLVYQVSAESTIKIYMYGQALGSLPDNSVLYMNGGLSSATSFTASTTSLYVVVTAKAEGSATNGTVTSVSLTAPTELTVTGSPITTSGTLQLTWATHAAAQVFASPTAATGVPSFRALAATDIPNLDAAKLTTGVLATARLGSGTASATTFLSGDQTYKAVAYTNVTGTPTLATVATSGAYTDLSGRPTLATVATSGLYTDLTGAPVLATVATSGSYNDLANKPTIPSGTVTSVGLTMPTGFTVTGSPLTTTGTLAVTLASATAKFVLAAPNAANGAPTFRALVGSDVPAATTSALGTVIVGSGLAVTAGTVSVSGTGLPYDITLDLVDVTTPYTNSQNIMSYIAVRPITVSSGIFRATMAATAATTLSIQKNSVEVGTIAFDALGQSSTVTIASAISLVSGDELSIVNTATTDLTLAGLYGTFLGTTS